MTVLSLFFKRLKILPHFLLLVVIDFVKWVAARGWTKFEGWGIHLYIGPFGNGKTCSMVRDVYNLCCKYRGMTVLTNLELKNFPSDTVIKPLNCARDIINASDNTLVVIDEIGTIWHSRDFNEGKTKDGNGGGLSKIVFQNIAQVRHRNIAIYGTAQHWMFLDIILRRITTDVTVCSGSFAHPFTRMVTNRCYNGKEYEMFSGNPLLPLVPVYVDCYVQTDKLRDLYDTKQMVETLLTMDYNPDSEIAADLNGSAPPPVEIPADKKKQRELLNKMKKGGL